MEFAPVVRRFGLDLALWFCIPTLFLALYVGHYAEPSSAIAPHLLVIALPLLALTLLRLALSRWLASALLRTWLTALLTSTLLTLLVLYYIAVLIGLHSWGGVVAWNVIPTFFAQASVMADALGISSMLIGAATFLLLAAVFVTCWLYARHADWTQMFSRGISSWTLAAILVGGSAILLLECYQFAQASWSRAAEPVSLTVYPPAAAMDLEGYSVNPVTATQLDRLEQEARRAYQPTGGGHRNLILIVVDALRPDHMSLYGYGRATTPNLARITTQTPTRVIPGVHSSCGDTVCALFSLLSSKFPPEFSFMPFTLQEVLRRNGYHVHMVLSGDHTYFHSLKGLYGQVDSFYDGNQAHDYFLNDDRLVIDHVAGMPDWQGDPVMFQFHLMSAHILRRNDTQPGRFQPAVRYVLHDSRDTGPGTDTLPSAVNFYDNGVLHADQVVSDLLQTLQNKGYLRDALVVITADHGEALGEHGLFHHANSVREELLRIPLVLISYGYQPTYSSATRAFPSQVDIAPTILDELGLPAPRTWSGRSLREPAGVEFSYFEEHAFAGLIDHRDPHHVWKYWIDRQSGDEHVFDLSADPHEERDARHNVPSQVLSDWHARALAGTSVALSDR